MIYVADMAISMSNFDNFDNDQISCSEIVLCLQFLLLKNLYPMEARKYQIKPFYGSPDIN